MAKTFVLDRVAADLARGFTHPAIQRLSSLVAAYPNDLDLRRRLAAVHRRVGNRIQAGRWDYLTIGADTRDTRAFERAFPSAMARLRAVRWPYRASEAATAYARSRLAKLVAAAEAERPAVAQAMASAPATERTAGAAADRPVPAIVAARPPSPPLVTSTEATSSVTLSKAGWSGLLRRWWPFVTPRPSPIPAAIASVAVTPLVVVGMVTVIEWLVQ